MMSATEPDPLRKADDIAPITFGFLLLPGFSLMSYAAAVEPLRAANQLSGRPLYRWWNASPKSEAVQASNGVVVLPDVRMSDVSLSASRVFVCAGGNPSLFADRSVFAWLRRLARRGLTIGGISGGPYVLARAGLLERRRCTLHWEHIPAFQEQFPHAIVARSLFEIDGDRITCSGGTAALDLLLRLIADDHGSVLAAAVSDWFLHDHIREGLSPQRMATSLRFGVHDQRLVRVLDAMEANLEEPLSRDELAALACVSPRQLDRMARAELGRSLHQHYLRQRLIQAARMTRETSLCASEIAAATGFASAAEFRRAQRKLEGNTLSRPHGLRRVRAPGR